MALVAGDEVKPAERLSLCGRFYVQLKKSVGGGASAGLAGGRECKQQRVLDAGEGALVDAARLAALDYTSPYLFAWRGNIENAGKDHL